MSEDAPAWLSHLTEWGRGFEERQASRFSELERRLDQTVTRDLFDAEKQRVNERFDQERVARLDAIKLEADLRKDADSAESKAREGLHEKLNMSEAQRVSSRRWVWGTLATALSAIFVAIASWVHP